MREQKYTVNYLLSFIFGILIYFKPLGILILTVLQRAYQFFKIFMQSIYLNFYTIDLFILRQLLLLRFI